MHLKVLFLVFLLAVRTTSCEPSVIIIGAGSAGLAAATRLLKNNFTNLIILEAEDRVGGRVDSVKFGDAYVDLGAELCHGERGNVVYEMVKDLEILSFRNSDYLTAYYSSGEEVPKELNDGLYEIIGDIYTPGNKNQQEGVSLGDYCRQEYNSRVRNLNTTDSLQARFIRDFVPHFEHYVVCSEGAFSWFDPSAKSDYRDCDGRQDWTWSGLGYKTALQILTEQHPIESHLKLNKTVQKLHWNQARNTVTVTCQDRTNYTADLALFTPSLGVLKEQHRRMFQPALPAYKTNAIEKIGFGSGIKVMLEYREAWWPVKQDFPGFGLVWAEEHRRGSLERFQLNGKSWLLAMAFVLPVENNPNVLSVWFLGPSVPYIEALDEDSLVEGIDYAMRLFLGHLFNVSHPISLIRSNWYSNPHFRGTYSFQTVASRNVKSNVHLGQPLKNSNGKQVVFFAGEATHPTHYSTVHGAIETGFREADRIIDLHNKP